MYQDYRTMTHHFTGASFVLAIKDLEISSDFYSRVLGFKDQQVDAPGWRFMERDGCRIQLGECPDAIPAGETGDHSYFCYLYVDDATGLYAHAKHEKAEIIKEIRDEPWGVREFALRTPDGHRIMIGQHLKN